LRLGLSRSEISGAFADLGLLIPLEAALIAVNGLNPTSTLLGVGILYIAAGWYFGLPMPVQPLKALAAIAIAEQLSPDVIAAGALLMSLSLGVLAVTGLIDRLYAIVPTVVVRGIQLGLAYVLIRGALRLLDDPIAADAAQPALSALGVSVRLMVIVAPLALLAIALLVRRPTIPASVAVLVAGVAAGLVFGRWHGGAALGPVSMSVGFPGADSFATAAAVLLTAQLPLTLANSVIATADGVRHYFPNRVDRATPRRISLSIVVGNLWAGFFGGLPVCHGSGGLTAHYRLGARTAKATALLGVILIVLAIVFGAATQSVRTLIPMPFFGILLLFVGIQHVSLAANVEKRRDLLFVGLTGVLTALFDGNLAYAGGVTLAVYWALQAGRWLRLAVAAPAPGAGPGPGLGRVEGSPLEPPQAG